MNFNLIILKQSWQKAKYLFLEFLRSEFHWCRYVLHRHELKENSSFHNKYLGKRCVIICTGASVKGLDLLLLRSEWVLSCNQFYLHPQATFLKFAGYFELDPVSSYVKNPKPFWREGQYHRELSQFANNVGCDVFLNQNTQDFCSNVGAHFRKPHYLVSSGRMSVASRLSSDLSGKFNMMDGVVFAMLGAAEFFGFKEIYMLGCDYTYSPVQSGHFYEDLIVHKMHPVDQRHSKAKEYLETKGIKVINVIPDNFTSPVYDSINFSKLLEIIQ